MFLAPCTLPLVPAYLAFIGGVTEADGKSSAKAHRKIFINAVAFVLGFSFIFVSFGILAGYFGSYIGPYRVLLSQIGGLFIIFFGLLTLQVVHFLPLVRTYTPSMPAIITPGEPSSAFIIGCIFALGWTPCVGPVLASILLLATTSISIFSGALLLLLFSVGLAIPFILTALLYSRISGLIAHYSYLAVIARTIGGVMLVLVGFLLLFDNFGLTVQYGYRLLEFFGIGNFLDYY